MEKDENKDKKSEPSEQSGHNLIGHKKPMILIICIAASACILTAGIFIGIKLGKKGTELSVIESSSVTTEYKESEPASQSSEYVTATQPNEEEFEKSLFGDEETAEFTEGTATAEDSGEKSAEGDTAETDYGSTNEMYGGEPLEWTVDEIVSYYNAARKNTPNTISGHQEMSLASDITGEIVSGTTKGVLITAVRKALSAGSKDVTGVPAQGNSDILTSDVKRASAHKDEDGNIVIIILLKDQTDTADSDKKDGGPVARGIGTFGNIDSALNTLGATIISGRDSIEISYSNAYIKDCVIDPETQQIVSSTYHYMVNVYIGDAELKLGVTTHLRGIQALINYTRTIG